MNVIPNSKWYSVESRAPALNVPSAPLLTSILLIIFSVLLSFLYAGGMESTTFQSVAFLLSYSALALTTSLYLGIHLGRSSALLFSISFLTRIILCILWTEFPPSQYVSLSGIEGVVYPDEAYYIGLRHEMASLSFDDPYERVALLFGLISYLAGSNSDLWVRLVHVYFTSLTSVLLFRSIRMVTFPGVGSLAWYVALLIPVLVVWSALYLKEPMLVFGVSLITYGLITREFTRVGGMVSVIIGSFIVAYFRLEILLFFAPIIYLTYLLPSAYGRRNMHFNAIAIAFFAATFFLIFYFDHVFISITEDHAYFEKMDRRLDAGDFSFPLFGFVSGLPEPIRRIGYFLLLMINPPITGVSKLLPIIGTPSWEYAVSNAYGLSWWLLLPFWPVTLWLSWKTRDAWWFALVAGMILWFFVSAQMAFGVGSDSYRYREALLPLTVVAAFKGYSFMASNINRRQLVRIYFALNVFFVLLLIILKEASIIGMG